MTTGHTSQYVAATDGSPGITITVTDDTTPGTLRDIRTTLQKTAHTQRCRGGNCKDPQSASVPTSGEGQSGDEDEKPSKSRPNFLKLRPVIKITPWTPEAERRRR